MEGKLEASDRQAAAGLMASVLSEELRISDKLALDLADLAIDQLEKHGWRLTPMEKMKPR